MTGPACTGSVMSPSVVVVASLKIERTRPAKFNIREESFIWLKAGSYNKSTALLGSTSTLCATKPLIQRVSTSAHNGGTMTLFGFIGEKDIGPSIDLVSSRLPLVWTVFTWALTVVALRSFFCWCFNWY